MTRSLAEPNSRLARAPIMGARSSWAGSEMWADLPVSDRQSGPCVSTRARRRSRPRRPRAASPTAWPLVGGRRLCLYGALLSPDPEHTLCWPSHCAVAAPLPRSRSARGVARSGGQEASPGDDPVVATVDGAPVHRARGRGGGARAARPVAPDADADAVRHAARPRDRLPPARRTRPSGRTSATTRRSRPRWPRRAPRSCATFLVQQTIEEGTDRGEAARALRGEEGARRLRPGGGSRAPHPACRPRTRPRR